jgi:hypothetical protein
LHPGDTSDGPTNPLVDLLHDELRAARTAALDEGTDPEEITADITKRVNRFRALNAAGWPPSGQTPPAQTSSAQTPPDPPPEDPT